MFLTQFKLLDNGVVQLIPNVPITLLKLKHFWENCIVHDDDIYYELQEIVDIYNKHDKASITCSMLKEFIELEHPSIIIDHHKILNIRCTLWDKISDIEIANELFKNQKEISDPYDFYCQYTALTNLRQVTKEYFIEYIHI